MTRAGMFEWPFGDDSDIDQEEWWALLHIKLDTSAACVRKGKHIQGITPPKGDHRREILEYYDVFEDVPLSRKTVDKEYKPTEKGANYYDFFYNCTLVKPTLQHNQIRNLVWATSKHDVYFVHKEVIWHWSSVTLNSSQIIDFRGDVTPTEEYPGSVLEGFAATRISSLAVKDNWMVVGGSLGQIVCKRLNKSGISFCTWTNPDSHDITNCVEIYDNFSGGYRFITSSNDCGVREYEMESFQLLSDFKFPWPVNHTSMSPDQKLIAVVGDNVDGLLVDSQTWLTVGTVAGHRDFSLASAWHPNGRIFATGNQDRTCRVWDIRNLSKEVAVLKSTMEAVHSVSFTSDGRFLVVGETVDFVNIYNTEEDYKRRQEIDFIGNIVGVSVSPDDECIYIGIFDGQRNNKSVMQFNRRHSYEYLDSIL